MEDDEENQINPEDFQFTYSMDKWDKKIEPYTSIYTKIFHIDINYDISKKKWKINKRNK